MYIGLKGAVPQSFLPTFKEIDEEGDKEESASVYDGGVSMALQVRMEILKPIAGDMPPDRKNGSS